MTSTQDISSSTISIVDPSKAKGDQVRTLQLDPPSQIYSVLFSPDSKVLAAGVGEGVHLFDVATGQVLHKLPNHQRGGPVALVFSKDGKSLVTRSTFDQTMREWGVATGKKQREFGKVAKLNPPLSDLMQTRPALSPDGTVVALAGVDQLRCISWTSRAAGKPWETPATAWR